MPDVICAGCGVTFHMKPSKVARAKAHYCSRECRKKDRRRICEKCGNEYLARPGAGGDGQRFCSVACSNRGRKGADEGMTDVACDNCGQIFRRWPSQLEGYQFHFCGMTCKNEFHAEFVSGEGNPRWTGGATDYRGADWPKARRAAIERDGHTCQECGISEAQAIDTYHQPLQVHHKIRYHDSQDNSLSNLVTLCVVCHGKADTRHFGRVRSPQS